MFSDFGCLPGGGVSFGPSLFGSIGWVLLTSAAGNGLLWRQPVLPVNGFVPRALQSGFGVLWKQTLEAVIGHRGWNRSEPLPTPRSWAPRTPWSHPIEDMLQISHIDDASSASSQHPPCPIADRHSVGAPVHSANTVAKGIKVTIPLHNLGPTGWSKQEPPWTGGKTTMVAATGSAMPATGKPAV